MDTQTGTIGAALDRLEVPAGKIGLNSPEQAFALLYGLDDVYDRLQELEEDNSSRKIAEAQFDGIAARLRKEAGRFIRDLGGLPALRQKRNQVKPPEDHWWWYLDAYVSGKRTAALKRSLVIAGVVVVAFLALAFLYERFLAPNPQDVAVYGHEQSARDFIMSGDLQSAQKEVDQGLQIAPKDGTLLILKGVIQEGQGQTDQAAQTFAAAQATFTQKDDFLVARGETYLQAGKVDKCLADAQAAAQLNPQSASAYLLLGQALELQKNYQEALDQYNKAFEIADKNKQNEMAALARMRIAMLVQSMNAQIGPTGTELTPSPTP